MIFGKSRRRGRTHARLRCCSLRTTSCLRPRTRCFEARAWYLREVLDLPRELAVQVHGRAAEGDYGGGASPRPREQFFASAARRGSARTRIRVRLGNGKNLRKRVATWTSDRRAGRGATRRAIVAGRVPEHAPIESSSPQGPVISPTPSRGPRRARHSASAGLSGVTVRLPSPWRSEDATPLDELPPPAPPAPPPPPPAPRGPELPPLDIVFRRFTRRKPPPPPRGYACPVSDCHHGKILSFGAKRGAENQSENNSREGRLQVEASPQTGAHTKSRKLPIRRFLLSTSTVAGARRPPLASTRRARLRVCLRSVAMVLRNARPRRGSSARRAGAALSAGVIGPSPWRARVRLATTATRWRTNCTTGRARSTRWATACPPSPRTRGSPPTPRSSATPTSRTSARCGTAPCSRATSGRCAWGRSATYRNDASSTPRGASSGSRASLRRRPSLRASGPAREAMEATRAPDPRDPPREDDAGWTRNPHIPTLARRRSVA